MHSFMLVRHGHVVAEGWWSPYDADDPHVALLAEQELHLHGRRPGRRGGEAEPRRRGAEVLPRRRAGEPERQPEGDAGERPAAHVHRPSGRAVAFTRRRTSRWTKVVPGAARAAQARHAFPLQHAGDLHALGHRPEGDGPDACSTTCSRASSSRWASRTPTWETSPQGITLGGYGLSIRTEDIARFGQLYLQKGKWQGKQLVPAAWVEAATARQTSNGSNPTSDWDQGYGYQFWRCRHGAYRGDGAFGQFCVVLPEQDAVIAITSGVKDMQAVLNLVWDTSCPR